jgi:copper homeostasis protein
VESLDAALAAQAGGADRIELCTDLAHGGTTPELQLLRTCKSQLKIPVFVLVRPRPGDFVYTDAEHDTLLHQILRVKNAGAHGIVTGELNSSRQIAETRMSALLDAARPLPVTFHRAFDECLDLGAALEALIRLGVNRVLTSGGARTAPDGVDRLARLVTQAKERIEILPGGGITPDNVKDLVERTGVREVHFSVNDAEKLRRVRESLRA